MLTEFLQGSWQSISDSVSPPWRASSKLCLQLFVWSTVTSYAFPPLLLSTVSNVFFCHLFFTCDSFFVLLYHVSLWHLLIYVYFRQFQGHEPCCNRLFVMCSPNNCETNKEHFHFHFILFQCSDQKLQQRKTLFQTIARFQNVVGAIDGTLIPIRKPSENETIYLYRENFHAFNVIEVCDANLLFLYLSSIWDIQAQLTTRTRMCSWTVAFMTSWTTVMVGASYLETVRTPYFLWHLFSRSVKQQCCSTEKCNFWAITEPNSEWLTFQSGSEKHIYM